MDSLGYECIVRGIRRGAKPTRRGSDGGETRVEPELRNGRAVERRRRENPGMEESVSSGRDGHLGGPVAFGATRGGARRDVACLRARVRKRERVSVMMVARVETSRATRGALVAFRRRASRRPAPRASMGCSEHPPSPPTDRGRRAVERISSRRSAPTDASRGAPAARRPSPHPRSSRPFFLLRDSLADDTPSPPPSRRSATSRRRASRTGQATAGSSAPPSTTTTADTRRRASCARPLWSSIQ